MYHTSILKTLTFLVLPVILLSTTVLAFAPTSVYAQSAGRLLYVDASLGNDLNTGLSATAAWLTLAKANANVQAGDVVYLKGTFSGQQLAPAVSGTAANPITFKSLAGQTAVLSGGARGTAVYLNAKSYIVLDSLRIQNVPGVAIVLVGSNFNTIKNSSITDIINGTSWVSAIKMTQSSDNLIEGNTITNIGNATADQGDSIWLEDGSNRNRILNNTLSNGSHNLIFIGGDRDGQAEVGDNVVAGNTLSNPWGTLMGLSHMARRTIVEHNRFSDANFNSTNQTAATIQIVSSYHIIRYNQFFNNRTPGISLLAYTGGGQTSYQDSIGNQIYHNVFYGGLPGATVAGSYGIWMSEKGGRSVSNNFIANNIFFRNAGYPYGGNTYTIGIEHYSNPTAWPVGSLNGNRLENNIFLRQPGSAGEISVFRIRNSSQGGNLSYTMNQFQTTYPAAKNNLEVDPLFVNEATKDFHLQSGSPAIDKGTVLTGILYNGLAPDLGVYETGVVSPPPPPPTADLKVNGSDGPSLTVLSGSTVRLQWSSMNATSCTLEPGGRTGLSGDTQSSALTANFTYVLTCTGAGGLATDSIDILIQLITPPPPPPPPPRPSTRFNIGNRIQVISGPANVRSAGSPSATILGTQATGALGTVIGGPVSVDGTVWWWNIDYALVPDGWSYEGFLGDAPTLPPPPGATPVSNISFTPYLEGTTSLTGRDFTFTFFIPGTMNQVAQFTVQPSATGALAPPATVTLNSGTYDLTIDTSYYLRRRSPNVTVASNTSIPLPVLHAGDLNDDNVINSLDWSVMSPRWFTNDPASDLNHDGLVNSIDYSLLNSHWAEVGE